MSRLRDVVSFGLLAWLWGTAFTAVEVGLAAFPPLLLLALRYVLAGGVLLCYVAVTPGRWRPSTRADAAAIVGGGLFWIAVGNGVWFVGQSLTTSVLSGLMASLIPVLTTAFSWVLLPEDRLDRLSVVGLAVSFAGALLMAWPTDGPALTADLFGKVVLFVGVAGAALGSVLIRRANARISSPAQTAWSVLLGAVVISGLSLAVGEPWSPAITGRALAAFLYLSLPATVVAYLLFFSLLERYSAIELTLVTYLVPVVAASAGWLLFDEPLTRRMVGGFLVVLVGFVVLKRRTLREELDFPARW